MANSNPSLQANNRSLSNSGGKPTRILKIRAKRLTSQSNLSSAVSEPMINVMSKPSSPPSLAIGRRVRKRGNSPDQVTPPPLLDAVPEYDPSNSQTPDPALSRNSPSTPVNAKLRRMSLGIVIGKGMQWDKLCVQMPTRRAYA